MHYCRLETCKKEIGEFNVSNGRYVDKTKVKHFCNRHCFTLWRKLNIYTVNRKKARKNKAKKVIKINKRKFFESLERKEQALKRDMEKIEWEEML